MAATSRAARDVGTSPLCPVQRWIILRETAINVVANVGIGGAAAALAHGVTGSVPVRGLSFVTLEFIPQSFMITLVSVLIPGFIAARAVDRGKVPHLTTGRPRRIVPLALALAIAMSLLLGGVTTALCVTVGPEQLAASAVLAIKALYGAAIALCVTPIGARAGLRSGGLPRGASLPDALVVRAH